jgi:hypothetical protein
MLKKVKIMKKKIYIIHLREYQKSRKLVKNWQKFSIFIRRRNKKISQIKK